MGQIFSSLRLNNWGILALPKNIPEPWSPLVEGDGKYIGKQMHIFHIVVKLKCLLEKALKIGRK